MTIKIGFIKKYHLMIKIFFILTKCVKLLFFRPLPHGSTLRTSEDGVEGDQQEICPR